jgi:hypothetical protein
VLECSVTRLLLEHAMGRNNNTRTPLSQSSDNIFHPLFQQFMQSPVRHSLVNAATTGGFLLGTVPLKIATKSISAGRGFPVWATMIGATCPAIRASLTRSAMVCGTDQAARNINLEDPKQQAGVLAGLTGVEMAALNSSRVNALRAALALPKLPFGTPLVTLGLPLTIGAGIISTTMGFIGTGLLSNYLQTRFSLRKEDARRGASLTLGVGTASATKGLDLVRTRMVQDAHVEKSGKVIYSTAWTIFSKLIHRPGFGTKVLRGLGPEVGVCVLTFYLIQLGKSKAAEYNTALDNYNQRTFRPAPAAPKITEIDETPKVAVSPAS